MVCDIKEREKEWCVDIARERKSGVLISREKERVVCDIARERKNGVKYEGRKLFYNGIS